jgi:DNA polymerase sigma
VKGREEEMSKEELRLIRKTLLDLQMEIWAAEYGVEPRKLELKKLRKELRKAVAMLKSLLTNGSLTAFCENESER